MSPIHPCPCECPQIFLSLANKRLNTYQLSPHPITLLVGTKIPPLSLSLDALTEFFSRDAASLLHIMHLPKIHLQVSAFNIGCLELLATSY